MLGGCLKDIQVSGSGIFVIGFWSGYEHHQSTGLTNLEESSRYLRDQQRHHNLVIVGQQRLSGFG